MNAIELSRTNHAVTVDPSTTLSAAAALMDQKNVGALIVIDHDQLVGIVTDRDIVTRGVAKHLPSDARIDAVMTSEVVTLSADAEVRDAFPLLRTHAIRRLPLLSDGQVVGVVAVDDLLIGLIADLADVVRPITGEVIFGHHSIDRPLVATT